MRDGYTWVDLRDLRGEPFLIEDYHDGELLLRKVYRFAQKDTPNLVIITHDGLGFVAYTPEEET